jgi:hypothetical protein
MYQFSASDFQKIALALETEVSFQGNVARLACQDTSTGRKLSLEIHAQLDTPVGVQNLVSVYGFNAFLQLQNCTGFLASQELGEVIFFAKQNDQTCGLIVEKIGGCSLYANVQDALLQSDFLSLPPELLMSSVALSMTESLFSDLG